MAEAHDSEELPGHWLHETSDEFHQLRHYLLMCTPQNTVSNIEVWKIDNLEVSSIFERRAIGLLRIPSFVDPVDIEGDTIDQISRRGFNFRENGGMVFETGVLRFPSTLKNEYVEKILLYTEVAVGRSFVYDGKPGMKQIPAGYDSFYIPSQQLDRNNDGEFSLEEYHAAAKFDGRSPLDYSHKYFVQDPHQACPKYIVRFQYTTGTDVKSSAATTQASSLDQFEYFDPVDYRPVAVREKMAGQLNSRRLITTEQAYRQATMECEKEDSLLSGKKVWLEQQLTDVDETLRAINLNFATAHESLTAAYQNAISQLQSLTKEKLDCILSAELELRRQYEQILWGESFISNLLSNSGARRDTLTSDQKVDFLRVWKAHVVHRNAVCRFKTVETDILKSIKPDIVVKAEFKVGRSEILEYSGTQQSDRADKDLSKKTIASRLSKKDHINEDPQINGHDNDLGFGSATDPQRPAVSFMEHANKIGLFEYPIMAAEELISSMAKNLVDANSISMQEAYVEASKDSNFPLPASFDTPFVSGMVYPVPGAIDSVNVERSDGKSQFEAVFKKAIGEEQDLERTRDLASLVPQPQRNGSIASWLTPAKSHDPSDLRDRGPAVQDQTNRSKEPHQSGGNPTDGMSDSLGHQTASARHMKRIPASSHGGSSKKPDGTTLSIEALEEAARAHSQFSIKAISERKQRQLGSAVKSIAVGDIFNNSVILSKETAQDVYYTLPFFTKPPVCRLLYSTAMHRRGLDAIYKSCAQCPSAVVLLVRSNSFIFGAYLSHPLVPSSMWMGSPACFLFSVSLDMRLPYHGRRSATSSEVSASTPKAFFADYEHVEIGNGDLVLDQSLTVGRSEIEGCYGVGFAIGGLEAQCFLAGQPEFLIDEVEVWSI